MILEIVDMLMKIGGILCISGVLLGTITLIFCVSPNIDTKKCLKIAEKEYSIIILPGITFMVVAICLFAFNEVFAR